MLNISEIRKRHNENPLKLQNELRKYSIEELYDILKNVREFHEKTILKRVGKDKIIYKIRDYLLFIEKNIQNM